MTSRHLFWTRNVSTTLFADPDLRRNIVVHSIYAMHIMNAWWACDCVGMVRGAIVLARAKCYWHIACEKWSKTMLFNGNNNRKKKCAHTASAESGVAKAKHTKYARADIRLYTPNRYNNSTCSCSCISKCRKQLHTLNDSNKKATTKNHANWQKDFSIKNE